MIDDHVLVALESGGELGPHRLRGDRAGGAGYKGKSSDKKARRTVHLQTFRIEYKLQYATYSAQFRFATQNRGSLSVGPFLAKRAK